MVDYINKFCLLLVLFLFIISCGADKKKEVKNKEVKEYIGWWVYGEGQHIFKDEITLEDWDLIFPNEEKEALSALYLAVCEMEYFPMECMIKGSLNNDTLIAFNFEILHIQGCGE